MYETPSDAGHRCPASVSLRPRRFLVLALLLASSTSCGSPPEDPGAELRVAQALLSASEFDRAYEAYGKLAADRGDPVALFTMGMFHRMGWGRPVDPGAACGWFEKAAARDVPVAQHFLAEYLLEGVHRRADPARAVELLERSGSSGHFASYLRLGELYESGTSVPRDRAAAGRFYMLAAERGSPAAQVRVARILRDGDEGVPRNLEAAWRWYAEAARVGVPEAEYECGIMARDGRGRPASRVDAQVWLELSATHGYLPAYVPTALCFLSPDAGGDPSANLAKAYLWLSAALKRALEPAERAQASDRLEEVIATMPPAWRPDLDKKIADHLAGLEKKQP